MLFCPGPQVQSFCTNAYDQLMSSADVDVNISHTPQGITNTVDIMLQVLYEDQTNLLQSSKSPKQN